MDKLLLKLCLPALTLGLTVGLPAHADCKKQLCQDAGAHIPLPPGNRDVPANLPALVVRATELGSILTEGEDRPRLLRADGSPVPAKVSPNYGTIGVWEQLVQPEEPLVPGESYRLEARGSCHLQGARPPISATFTAGPARPLPETSGWLEVVEQTYGPLQVSHTDEESCWTQEEAAFARLRFVPAPELVPFLPWVHWRLEVDGQHWADVPSGEVGAEGVLIQPPPLVRYSSRSLFQVHTLCGREPLFTDQGMLTAGPHRVALHGTLSCPTPRALPPL